MYRCISPIGALALAMGTLSWGTVALGQEVILLDDGCYQAEVDGVVGSIDYDADGNLVVHDGDTMLAYAPDECYEIVAAQVEAEAGPPPDYIPPPPEILPPLPDAPTDSGVKNSATVPYCDELPAGSTQQCEQRIELGPEGVKQ